MPVVSTKRLGKLASTRQPFFDRRTRMAEFFLYVRRMPLRWGRTCVRLGNLASARQPFCYREPRTARGKNSHPMRPLSPKGKPSDAITLASEGTASSVAEVSGCARTRSRIANGTEGRDSAQSSPQSGSGFLAVRLRLPRSPAQASSQSAQASSQSGYIAPR